MLIVAYLQQLHLSLDSYSNAPQYLQTQKEYCQLFYQHGLCILSCSEIILMLMCDVIMSNETCFLDMVHRWNQGGTQGHPVLDTHLQYLQHLLV